MNVRVTFVARDRVTIGVPEFRFEGQVTMQIYTPSDKGTLGHENILDDLRLLFDDKDLETSTGLIRFEPCFVQTVGSVNNFYSSNIICLFTMNEYIT